MMMQIRVIAAGKNIALEYAIGRSAKQVSDARPNTADNLTLLLRDSTGNPNATALAWHETSAADVIWLKGLS